MDEAKLLIVYWRSPKSHRPLPIGRLVIRPTHPRFEFSYVAGVAEASRDGFHPFPEFPDLDASYASDAMFALFSNRLMTDSRSEYHDYVARHGLEPASATQTDLLLRTDGRRATDPIEIFALPSCEDGGGSCVSRFFVRAIDRVDGAEAAIDRLEPGDILDIDPSESNGLSIGLRTPEGRLIGYMPDRLADDAASIVADPMKLRVSVVRHNPPPAPIHHRLLCRLDADSASSGAWLDQPRFRSRAKACTAPPGEV